MADTNPANFANLPKERVQEIASMGGKASHGENKDEDKSNGHHEAADKENHNNAGRRQDGTFLPGSDAARAAGHKGGLHAAGEKTEEEVKEGGGHKSDGMDDEGRRPDGTFKPGSEAAKAAGHKGGVAAAAASDA